MSIMDAFVLLLLGNIIIVVVIAIWRAMYEFTLEAWDITEIIGGFVGRVQRGRK